jgi:hypothetical protein
LARWQEELQSKANGFWRARARLCGRRVCAVCVRAYIQVLRACAGARKNRAGKKKTHRPNERASSRTHALDDAAQKIYGTPWSLGKKSGKCFLRSIYHKARRACAHFYFDTE